jgi:cysteine sulfinate desulfinase/cysteine desulfurase-like protein
VTSAIEHPAVLEYLKAQAAEGMLTYTAVGVQCVPGRASHARGCHVQMRPVRQMC